MGCNKYWERGSRQGCCLSKVTQRATVHTRISMQSPAINMTSKCAYTNTLNYFLHKSNTESKILVLCQIIIDASWLTHVPGTCGCVHDACCSGVSRDEAGCAVGCPFCLLYNASVRKSSSGAPRGSSVAVLAPFRAARFTPHERDVDNKENRNQILALYIYWHSFAMTDLFKPHLLLLFSCSIESRFNGIKKRLY